MRQCDVRLVLDDPRGTYAPGDVVTGEVQVTVHADTRCDSLTVAPEWVAQGRGNGTQGKPKESTVTLFQGIWSPGETPRFRFQLTIPNGPLSYDGTHLNVGWHLVANADLPLALDVRDDVPFTLLPSPSQQPGYSVGEPIMGSPVQLDPRGSTVALGCFTVFLMLFVVPGLIAIAVGMLQIAGLGSASSPLGWMTIVWGLLFAGIPGGALFFLWAPKVAERRLGPVTITVQPENARAGEMVHCRLACVPVTGLRIDAAAVRFVGRERVVSGSGKHSTTHTHELLRQDVRLLGSPRTLRAGEPLLLDWTLEIPRDAPPTFHASANHLEWVADLVIRIPFWPDWSRKAEVRVEG